MLRTMNITLENFVHKSLKLLQKEREAEIAESSQLKENVSSRELEQRGVCLQRLRLASQHSGLYGRTVLVFEPFWPDKPLPAHKFTPGDIAGLHMNQAENNEDAIASGIVSRVSQSAISIAFDESHDVLALDNTAQYRIIQLSNDVTYKRMKNALEELNKYRSGPCCNLIDVLFGSKPAPPFCAARDGEKAKHLAELVFFNDKLDDSQREAVKFALHQRDLAVVHGPPGTGKTTTVVEIIRQAVKQGLKVLACAPSNIAVDNLVERLATSGSKLIRLGHPARLLPTIQRFSLDAVLSHGQEAEVVNGIRSDLEKTMKKLQKTNVKGERQQLQQEMRLLRKDLRQEESTAVERVLKSADVVLGTLTTANSMGKMKYLEDGHFDLVIIDECSQAIEAACWIALLHAPRCILAGDHKQLPPTIVSHQAAADGLARTLMERQIDLHGEAVVRMLTMQYRMNHAIMDWASAQLYDNRLEAHESVAEHVLSDLPGIEETEGTRTPLLLIDTAGCDLNELDVSSDVSKGNEGEVELVAHHVQQLASSGLSDQDIAVISPYNLQVELIRLRLLDKFPKLEIKSVDGFQGREKEAVIISMVRSNEKGEVGFLAEDRRINVAITRARRHLAVICDSDTMSHHAFLKNLVDYMMENGEVHSAQQYIQDGSINMGTSRPDYLEAKITSLASRQTVAKKERKQTEKKAKKPDDRKDGKKKPGVEKPASAVIPDDESISIEETLNAFIKSKDLVHAFPPTLSPKQRYEVHELAETLGLLHLSEGDGADRHITVSKPIVTQRAAPDVRPVNTPQEVDTTQMKGRRDMSGKQKGKPSKQNNNTISQEAVEPALDTKKGATDGTLQNDAKLPSSDKRESNKEQAKVDGSSVAEAPVSCDKCGRSMPATNLALHQLRCSGMPPPQTDTTQSKKDKKPKNKKKNKSKVEQVPEEDFDALIAAAMTQNSSCAFGKCKQNAATLGRNCEFCAKRFCLTHHIPEGHGCGEAARTHARQMISREGVLYRGSGVPDKKLDPVKRAHLQRRLDKKLDELHGKRMTKKSSSDK